MKKGHLLLNAEPRSVRKLGVFRPSTILDQMINESSRNRTNREGESIDNLPFVRYTLNGSGQIATGSSVF